MYKLRITDRAEKELKKISLSHQEAILAAFEVLRDDPYLGKPLTRELTGRYSYRMGIYRIIYTINEQDKIVSILTAGHRATVYS